jgi:hypothetical protein
LLGDIGTTLLATGCAALRVLLLDLLGDTLAVLTVTLDSRSS